MTQYLPANLLALFTARPPIVFKPPVDKLKKRKNHVPYNPVSHFLGHFETVPPPPATRGETREEFNERKKDEKRQVADAKLQEKLVQWDPHADKNAAGDPFKTLFVARINYDTTESKLRRELESYGPIREISLVYSSRTRKPRGYAFVEYEHERDMHSAYKHADGKKIDGRRILVDVERGRTVKSWRPRRLGGGLGGTRRGGPDENIRHSGRVEQWESTGGASREQTERSDRDKTEEKTRKRSRSPRERRERDRGDRDRDRGERRRDRDRSDRDRDRDRGDRDRDRDRGDRGDRDRDRGEDRAERDRGRDEERIERLEEGEEPDEPEQGAAAATGAAGEPRPAGEPGEPAAEREDGEERGGEDRETRSDSKDRRDRDDSRERERRDRRRRDRDRGERSSRRDRDRDRGRDRRDRDRDDGDRDGDRDRDRDRRDRRDRDEGELPDDEEGRYEGSNGDVRVKTEEQGEGEQQQQPPPPPPPPPPPQPPSGGRVEERNGGFERFESVNVKSEKQAYDQNVPIPASYE